ncbi:Contactin-associated protein-like 4 [Collichthys lucidus]|uniref:Contactin-associated protein-like 4 n=1 Tax=Collichthys lucidus TaxID=240159 RepID=A0A4U5UX24_COLLU|nr:Contactin-associated protein-like 4 [Collichthys lucidus]
MDGAHRYSGSPALSWTLWVLCYSANQHREVCDSALVSNLPPSSFRSSSQLSSSHAPGFAKLNRRDVKLLSGADSCQAWFPFNSKSRTRAVQPDRLSSSPVTHTTRAALITTRGRQIGMVSGITVLTGAGGWSPLTSDRYQWLEVDLGERTKITAVATQGRYGSSDWLTSYLLMFSDTGHNWKQYRQEDSIGSFPGNSNADSVVQYKLQQPTIARFLRLIPLEWNPSGRIGLRLETYGCPYTSDVVSLDDSGSSSSSSSSLVYRLSTGPRRTSSDVVTLKFKTLRNSGTLLHAEGEGGLGLSLELERGKLQLLLRQGRQQTANRPVYQKTAVECVKAGEDPGECRFQWLVIAAKLSVAGRTPSSEPRRLASLGSLLDDQHWHHLAVERRGSHLNLTVDKHTERVQIPAEFSHWDIEQLSVGALQSSQKPVISKMNFHGCLENLLYNDLNLIQLVKHKDHRATVKGNVTFSCAEPVSVAVTFPGPQSFLQLPLPTATASSSSSGGLTVGFQFRTWNKAGLLLTFALPQEGGVVWLYLSEARLRLQIHKAGRALLELSAGVLPVVVNTVASAVNPGPSSTVTALTAATAERPATAETRLKTDLDGERAKVKENTWMVIQHNNTELTRVRPSSGLNPHSVHFDYPTEEEQLLAVISQSEHCEQELSYHCRKSRLLNTPEGSPFSWWLGGPGPGRVQTYWGGSQPGSQQCACGLQGDCVDPQHYCNCDADRMEWY